MGSTLHLPEDHAQGKMNLPPRVALVVPNPVGATHISLSFILTSLLQEEIGSDTRDMEIQLEGVGPWSLSGKPIVVDAPVDPMIIFTPGHTRGHTCLLYASEKTLFSGDHLSQDESRCVA